MTRAALILALLALGLAACGDGEENGRAPASESPTPRASAPRAEEPSRAEIEELAKVKLPASARDMDARITRGIDTGLFVRFAMDRDEVDGFVRDSHLDAKTGFKPSYPYAEEGWNLDRIQNTLGAEEFDGSTGREVVIDLDRPDVATVYLVATTV